LRFEILLILLPREIEQDAPGFRWQRSEVLVTSNSSLATRESGDNLVRLGNMLPGLEPALSRREVLARTVALMFVGDTAVAESRKSLTGESVIAGAGRRVDAPGAQSARFPSTNIELVKRRIQEGFSKNKPSVLVTSAACGTDLLSLEIAGQMNVERFILLPSAPAAFRASSVTDRPGNWGALFDRMIKESHVEVLSLPEGQEGYLETNLRLLDKAQALAKSMKLETKAMVIWDQKSRGSDDVTAHFLAQARERGLPVVEISTV
jgi:hypothetical protein